MSTYGPLTTESWMFAHKQGIYLHVFLDGVEITTDCEYANDEAGIVVVAVRNIDGKRYIDPETLHPAREEKHGRVEIVPEPIAYPSGNNGNEVF